VPKVPVFEYDTFHSVQFLVDTRHCVLVASDTRHCGQLPCLGRASGSESGLVQI